VTLAALNALDRDAFVQVVGWIFEHSPWIAERAWVRRPFSSVQELHGALVEEMYAAQADEQLGLLRAHPDLGARMRMSHASTGEQSSAGLDRLTPHDFDRLQRLNADYRQKFGFPFLFAVKGSTPAEILEALQQRLPRDHQSEFAEGLRQVAKIARFRLEETIAPDVGAGEAVTAALRSGTP
jgi:2-oxo-4-hydroxy-4-carboxy-5-ureidoimidazoline decarboxylase